MTRCLVVGGVHDGEWVDADDNRPSLELVEKIPLSMSAILASASAVTASARKSLYTRREWRSGDYRWVVWGDPELSDADLFTRLLSNYRPRKKAGR